MDDLISRAAATRAAVISVRDYLDNIDSERDVHIEEGLHEVPAVDAVPVVHGRWIQADLDKDYVTCSCCKANGRKDRMAWTPEFAKTLKYCPNCGARMGGERRESE